jgi:hypothetical protein
MKEGLTLDPNFIPGYWMEPGSWRETVNNPQLLFTRIESLGAKLPDFMETISVGKEKLKKLVAKVTGHKGQKLDNAVEVLLDGIVSRKQDRPSLAKKPEA